MVSVCVCLAVVFVEKRSYHSYKVLNTSEQEDVVSTQYVEMDGDILRYSPDGVSVVDIPPEITVNISITKLEDKKLTVTVNSFVLDKQVDGYQYEVTINNFTITASGFADVVSKLTLDDVVPTIDCSGLPVGNHGNVTVTLKEIDGVTYTMSGTVSVNVTNAENK